MPPTSNDVSNRRSAGVNLDETQHPGLYNEECPLARLAVPSWSIPIVAADILAQPDPAPALAAAPVPDQPATPRTGFAARAPPTS